MAKLSASFFSKLHRIFYFGCVLFFFILAYPLLWFYAKRPEPHYVKLAGLRRWIAVNSAFCAGIRFNISMQEDIDWSRNYIICANHSSILDITALLLAYKGEFSFMGKVELLDNPVTRLFFKTIDIPVDRSSRVASFKAFIKAKEVLVKNRSLVIFPEGGIDPHFPPQLSLFKHGAFKLALDAGVPVLPIVIHDAWQLCWDDGAAYGTRPGRCHVTILPAIETGGFLEAKELSDVVFSSMQEFLMPEHRNKMTKLDSN